MKSYFIYSYRFGCLMFSPFCQMLRRFDNSETRKPSLKVALTTSNIFLL